MNLDKPLVSVLMTAYNREKFISEAIESVLTSTYSNFELIIVDDCSKDSTVEIAKSYEVQDKRIRVYNNEINQGDYPNRNTAAGYARGKYLKYVDSDDLIYPHGLEIFVTAMEQFPEAALSFSSRIAQWDKPFPMYLEPNQSLRTHFFQNGFLDTGPLGVIIRTDAFHESGGFSGINMTGDTECWMKMALRYPLLILPPGLIYWRQHDGQQFNEGIRNDIYLKQGFSLINQIVKESGGLLTVDEKSQILKNNRQNTLKLLLKKMIKTGKLKHYWNLYKELFG